MDDGHDAPQPQAHKHGCTHGPPGVRLARVQKGDGKDAQAWSVRGVGGWGASGWHTTHVSRSVQRVVCGYLGELGRQFSADPLLPVSPPLYICPPLPFPPRTHGRGRGEVEVLPPWLA